MAILLRNVLLSNESSLSYEMYYIPCPTLNRLIRQMGGTGISAALQEQVTPVITTTGVIKINLTSLWNMVVILNQRCRALSPARFTQFSKKLFHLNCERFDLIWSVLASSLALRVSKALWSFMRERKGISPSLLKHFHFLSLISSGELSQLQLIQ